MFHLAGWFQDVDQAAAAADIAAMPDESLTIAGNAVRCPMELTNLMAAAFVSIATTFVRARVESPTLRRLANFDILPVNRIATPEEIPAIALLGANPLGLTGGEDVTFNTDTDHAAAIEIYGGVWFSDGAQNPISGPMFTIRATAGITQVDGVWTNGALTFSEDLPVGTYQVVGLRVQAAGLVFARLVFVGGGVRPGVLGAILPEALDVPAFRYGGLGPWGQFSNRTPPTLDVVGVTGTAQVVDFDLIQV